MIINQNNKDTILKGTMKRGFNQAPSDIKDKLYNNFHNIKNEEKMPTSVVKQNNILERSKVHKINESFNNLKRLNK